MGVSFRKNARKQKTLLPSCFWGDLFTARKCVSNAFFPGGSNLCSGQISGKRVTFVYGSDKSLAFATFLVTREQNTCERLRDNCETTARQLRDNCETTAGQLRDNCGTTAGQLGSPARRSDECVGLCGGLWGEWRLSAMNATGTHGAPTGGVETHAHAPAHKRAPARAAENEPTQQKSAERMGSALGKGGPSKRIQTAAVLIRGPKKTTGTHQYTGPYPELRLFCLLLDALLGGRREVPPRGRQLFLHRGAGRGTHRSTHNDPRRHIISSPHPTGRYIIYLTDINP
jgi:hypothetical protein